MTVPESLERDYRAAFLRYLPRRDEVALHTGYKLGRAAVHDRVSILDLAQLHDILLEVIGTCSPTEVVEVATGGSEFFLEVLAPYDMAQRGFLDELPGAGALRAGHPATRCPGRRHHARGTRQVCAASSQIQHPHARRPARLCHSRYQRTASGVVSSAVMSARRQRPPGPGLRRPGSPGRPARTR